MPNRRLISVKVEPQSTRSRDALPARLRELASADPDMSFEIDAESGETFVHGASELHLDSVIDALKADGIDVCVSGPKVAYREKIACATDFEGVFATQPKRGTTGVRIKLRIEPNAHDGGNVFQSEIECGAIAAFEKGIRSVLSNGVLIGFPLVDTKVTLLEAAFDENTANADLTIAARAAMKGGCAQGGIRILEPVMKVEVKAPITHTRPIRSDINARRGQILGQDVLGTVATTLANVPLAQMFGYASALKTLTAGTAAYSMQYSHYEVVPRNVTPPDDFSPAVGMRA